MGDTIGRKNRVRAYVTVLVTSFLGSLILSHSVHALSLRPVDSATNLLRQLVTGPEIIPSSPNSESSALPAKRTQASVATPSSAPSNPAKASPHKVEMAEVTSSQITPLSPLAPLATFDTHVFTSQTGRVAFTSAAVSGALKHGSRARLQPTEQGWELFGILWYWWLFGGVLVGLSGYRLLSTYSYYRKRPLVS